MSDPQTFMGWLRAQAKSDPEHEQAFAGLYPHGKYLAATLGEGPPVPVAFRSHLMLEGVEDAEADDLMHQLVIANATWLTDSMDDEPAPAAPTPTPSVAIEAPALKPAICGFRDLDGTQCRSAAVEGAARCRDHGGAITDPQVRGSLLLLAYAQLTSGTKKAVDALIEVLESSPNDLARVNAAKELLDRAGLSIDQHHTVTQSTSATDTRDDALKRIKAHLDSTRARLLPAPPDDDEIIDAEIVEDVA